VLLTAREMPQVACLVVPDDVYFALLDPAPLAGMRHPRSAAPWAELQRAGIAHVVCLTSDTFSYDPSPLHPLLAVKLQDLVDGGLPADPEGDEAKIRKASGVVARALVDGQGVVVHCEGGTGRSGTVIGGALRLLGYPMAEVVGWLERLNRARGRSGWPESLWQASVVERIAEDESLHRPPRGRS